MKRLIWAPFMMVALFATSTAFGQCISRAEAYERGYNFGVQLCQDAKYSYADQIVVSAFIYGVAPQFCDYYAILHCKSGFRTGYNSGRSEYVAGIYVPSCRSLYSRNIFLRQANAPLQSVYIKAQQSACSS